MILLLLGTNPYPFTRLLSAVDQWAEKSGVPVIAQTGHTAYTGTTIEAYDFVDYSQVVEWIEKSELVICQGGFGSLKDCISLCKNVIAVPRRIDLDECKDDQKELVDALAAEGLVIPLYDVGDLAVAIDQAHKLDERSERKSAIPRLVSETIREYLYA